MSTGAAAHSADDVPAISAWALLAPVARQRLAMGSTGYGILLAAAGVGAALWGVVAQWTGLVTAFVLAGAVLMPAAGGGAWRWPLITPLSADRRAISYWADHLEQHHDRRTGADRAVQQRVSAETEGAPVVEHLFLVDPELDELPTHVSAVAPPDRPEGASHA